MSNIPKVNYSSSDNLERDHFLSKVSSSLVVPIKVKAQQTFTAMFSPSFLSISISVPTSQVACLAYFILYAIPLWKMILANDINILNL